MSYETLRGKPRIIVVGKPRSFRVDFAEYLDVTPEERTASVEVARANAGNVQVLRRSISSDLRLRVEGLTLSEGRELQQLFDVFVANGLGFEVIMDRLRGHRLIGDDLRDSATGWYPFLGAETASLDGLGGLAGLGGIGVFPGTAHKLDRIELVKNGDMVDGAELALPTNWTNETTATINPFKLRYLGPLDSTRVKDVQVLAVHGIQDGDKSLAVAFDLGQYDGADIQYDSPPYGTYNISFMARVDMHPTELAAFNSGGNELMSVALRPTGAASSTRDDQTDVQLTTTWKRFFLQLTPATSNTSRTGHVVFDFTDDIDGATVYLYDVRMNASEYWGGPAPYSSSRSSADGTATKGHVVYLNRLLYGNQIPDWEDSNTFGLTFSTWYTPFWSSTAGQRGPEFPIVTGRNDAIDFNEGGGGELNATIPAGQYTGQELADAVTDAMNAVAVSNTYSCTYSTSTNKFTIARATGATSFSILWATGTRDTQTAATILGYSTGANDTGLTSYEADSSDTGYLTLIQLCDTTTLGNRAALWVYVTSQKVYCKFLRADGTLTEVSFAHTFTAGTPVHICFTVTDGGHRQLWINGSSVVNASPAAHELASVGKFFLLGSHTSTRGACCGVLSDFRLDPVEVDGTTYTISDFYDTSQLPERFQNSWRVKLDRRGKALVSFDDKRNAYSLDARLHEDVVFPG